MSEGIQLGPILLRWHSFFIVFGIAVGALLSAYETKRRGHDPEIIYYLFLPLLIWGTIGARLWHVLTPPLSAVQLGLTTKFYFSNPFDMIAFWVGGFGIPGAVLGGTLGLLLFSRSNQLPFWHLTDLLAPGLLLAQIIGRFGDFFNQEIYGPPSNLPWAIFIDSTHRLNGYENIDVYHPLFAYEMILNVFGLILLLWLSHSRTHKLPSGGLFLVYIMFYSLIRFLLEFLRLDPAIVGGVNANQVFFVVTFLISGILLYLKTQREVYL